MSKKLLFLIVMMLLIAPNAFSQVRDKKNLVVKEWNTAAGGKTRYLDHITTYNADGRKIEEIEYANYGQKSRVTYEYNSEGRCTKQVVYDAKNKVVRIRKFEYYPDGSKKMQYNYAPNGNLISSKEFEYIFPK